MTCWFRSFISIQWLLPAALSVGLLGAQGEELTACRPLQSSAYAEAGQRSMAARQYEEAAASFRRALEACPDELEHKLSLAAALTSLGKFEDAVREAKEYLRLHADSNEGRLVLANAYLRAQRFADCGQVVDKVLASDPRSLPALKLKANVDYLLGEETAATQTLMRALELYPNDPDTAYMLGRMYYQQNSFELAIGQFERVLKLDAQSYKTYDNLGLCYEALNQDELAIRYYMTAIKLVYTDHPEYEWPYANLANLLLNHGEDKKAFSLAAEAAKRNPSSARNFYLTGKALWKLEETESALRWLERSAQLDPNYAEPEYLLGQIYQKLGRADDAKKAFAEFERISKDAPRPKR